MLSDSALLGLPAPAKLNLFLHVVGRRPDGKHLLESVFTLIDLHDTIDLFRLEEPVVERTGDVIGNVEKDLCVRAARLLMETFDVRSGVRIHVEKRIPAGAGMGGGSSDAATVLIGLNRLFGLGLSRSALMELGERLGADVPFFIFGRTGFVEGIGEIITPLEIPPASYAVIWPGRGISTAEIFVAPNLTRDTKSLKIDILSGKALEIWPNLYGHNDLQNVAQELEHRVTEGLGMLACGTHDARMTGSGSAVFGVIADPCSYRLPQLPDGWKGFAAKSLREHPLSAWLD